MKSFKKSILAVGLTLGIIASLGGSAFCVAYRPYETGYISGNGTVGCSDVTSYGGSAYTYYGGYASTLSVNSTYISINTRTGVPKIETKSAGHYKNASVSFTVPAGSKSVSIYSYHKIVAGAQNWSVETFDDNDAVGNR